MMRATLTSKGQITIPKPIREALKLKVGGKVDFSVLQDGRVVLCPVATTVDGVFGSLHHSRRKSVSIEDMDEGIRKRIREKKG
jgi:AbrB family looped-hinge helix DNA binding protein